MSIRFKAIKYVFMGLFLMKCEAFAQLAAQKAGAGGGDPAVEITKIKEEQLKFEQENSRMRSENIEAMRAMAIKNTNILFDRLAENQRVLNGLSEESVRQDKGGQLVIEKGREFQEKQRQLQRELDGKLRAEVDKFQQIMQKRQASMSARWARAGRSPASASKEQKRK